MKNGMVSYLCSNKYFAIGSIDSVGVASLNLIHHGNDGGQFGPRIWLESLGLLSFLSILWSRMLSYTVAGSSSGNKIIIRAFIVSVPISVVWAVTQTVLEFTVKPVIEHAKVIGDNGTHTGGSGNDAYFLYGGVKFMLAESSFFVVVSSNGQNSDRQMISRQTDRQTDR